MDQIGLASNITDAAITIDTGRKGFANEGKEREGRISFEKGIAEASSAFKEARASADPQTIILVEYAFITQELALCDETDKDTINSLELAIQSFDDAFLALQAVEEPGYKTADKAFPHRKEYRIQSFPKDAFHIACKGHQTRLSNILRAPGIDPIEKMLLKQRLANLPTAQSGYIEKQKEALA